MNRETERERERDRKGEYEREGSKVNPLQHVPFSHPSCRGKTTLFVHAKLVS